MEKAYKLEFANERQGSLSVNCCGCSRTEPLHSFGPALKPYYLIHYVLSGRGILSMNRKEYRLEAGCGFLITPEELVFYQADAEDPWTYVWVGFGGTGAAACMESMGLSGTGPVFRAENSEELYHMVREMMEHNTYSTTDTLKRDGLLHLFLAAIAQSGNVSEKNDSDRANRYVNKAIEFIQQNYCNPIKITDVAEYVCLNRSYLYTLFEETILMSPQQFLTSYRITKAMELLQLTQLSVESIALSCGYQDPIVFTKAFRQMKGMSPSAYRREILTGKGRRDQEQLTQVEELISQVREHQQGRS